MRKIVFLLVLFAIVGLFCADQYYTNNPQYSLNAITDGEFVVWDTTTHSFIRLGTATATLGGDVAITGSVTTDKYTLDPTPTTADSCSGFRANMGFGDTIAQWDALYMNADGELYRADADTIITMPVVALAVEAGTDGTTKEIITQGFVYNSDWSWTIGGLVYASGTLGGITQTAPVGDNDVVQIIGWAASATSIYFDPDMTTIVLTVP